MSACLPGLGQIYNKKYWKVPIIYGGAVAVVYSANWNSKYYKMFKVAYKNRVNGDSIHYSNYSDTSLQTARDYYRKYLELSYIIGGAIYIMNIIDAAVDAHLYHFDISDNLSMKINPVLIPIHNYSFAGLLFSFTFGKNNKTQHY